MDIYIYMDIKESRPNNNNNNNNNNNIMHYIQ